MTAERESCDTLTEAERRVLRSALGRSNDEIATLLGVSPSTVAAQILSARRKLGSVSKNDAARRFAAWEELQQKQTKPFSVMADSGPAADEGDADEVLIRDTRTPFLFAEMPATAPTTESQHVRYRPIEKPILALIGALLILLSFHYLPDLARWAQAVGNMIRPMQP
jgi:DNA-binding CsgD family transcriptional regulator